MSEATATPVRHGDVLVVDDAPANRFLYRAILEDEGYVVHEACDGVEALATLARLGPLIEVVLLDVSMPGMDGIEVLRHIRARGQGGPAVLILTSAARSPADIGLGLELGADAYLVRPVDNRELAARVRAAVQIHRLRGELAALRRDQTAMVVHDLRHPLGNLAMLAEVIESEELSGDDRRELAGTIRRLAGDLGRLVNSILTASTLEAGVFTVDLCPVSLSSVLLSSVETFRVPAQRRRVTLEVGPLPDVTVNADAPKLGQVCDNLLSNALKFSPRGGKIAVRVALEPGRVRVEVCDSGPGVPEHERALIFDRYLQGAKGRGMGGTGLGLAIAAGILGAHGGDIACDDAPEGGARMSFTLPLGGAAKP